MILFELHLIISNFFLAIHSNLLWLHRCTWLFYFLLFSKAQPRHIICVWTCFLLFSFLWCFSLRFCRNIPFILDASKLLTGIVKHYNSVRWIWKAPLLCKMPFNSTPFRLIFRSFPIFYIFSSYGLRLSMLLLSLFWLL